jgi:tRNA/rRNA methyltransferase
MAAAGEGGGDPIAIEIAEAAKNLPAPATHAEIEGFFGHLESAIIASGFLDPDKPKRLIPRLRRLFGRARLEKEEVAILRGILASFITDRAK